MVQLDDLAPIYEVSEIDPPIAPYLLITEDFNYNGEGACNTFNGTYNFNIPNYLTATVFVATTNDCNIQLHNLFEDAYFGYISNEFWYDITQDGGGNVLTLGNPLGGIAVFKSYPLSVKDFNENVFTVYPNPAKNELFLSSTNTTENLTLKIFNIGGKLLSTQNIALQEQTSLDVSQLVSGIYFLNIEDERGNTATKKFIKE
jgi:heat shock protein HslJ